MYLVRMRRRRKVRGVWLLLRGGVGGSVRAGLSVGYGLVPTKVPRTPEQYMIKGHYFRAPRTINLNNGIACDDWNQ